MGNEEKAKKIVEKIGEYVNRLDRHHLGLPMEDEIAVMQMENIVEQILENPTANIIMPEYD